MDPILHSSEFPRTSMHPFELGFYPIHTIFLIIVKITIIIVNNIDNNNNNNSNSNNNNIIFTYL